MYCCRCGEITICKSKIKKLKNAELEISQYNQSFGNIRNSLSKIASSAPSAYETSDMSDFKSAIYKLDDDLKDVREALKRKLSDRIDELMRDLEQMEEDDAEYHAEDDTTNSSDSTSQINS